MANGAAYSAIEEFVRAVSADTLDEMAVRGDSELSRVWNASRSPDTAERVDAVRQLANHAHPAVARRLKYLLREDSDLHVRVACVTALTRVAPTESLDILCEALALETSPEAQLELGLAIIQHSGAAQKVDVLRRAVARPDFGSVPRSVINEYLATPSGPITASTIAP